MQIIYIFLFILLSFFSCIKDENYSIPPINCNLKGNFSDEKVNFSLDELINFNTNEVQEIQNNWVFEAFVSSSDYEKNHFYVLYCQDRLENPTKSIVLNINKSGLYNDFPLGSKIRIYTKGLFIGSKNGNIQLGSDFDLKNIPFQDITNRIQTTCDEIKPIIPLEFTSIKEALKPENIGKLIKLKNVQFSSDELGKTFATLNSTQYRILEDFSERITLKNSNFATFTLEKIPEGNGEISGILNKNLYDYQLVINKFEDIKFKNPRLFYEINDSFDNLNNWKSISVKGDQKWEIASFQGNNYAKISGFSTKNNENEDWLILNPVFIPSSMTKLTMDFDSDVRFFGNKLEVFISTEYISGNPNLVNWIKLNPKLDTNSSIYNFVNSDEIDLISFKGNKISIAFKYISTNSSASTWQIDNFKLKGF